MINRVILYFSLLLVVASCNSRPTVIESEPVDTGSPGTSTIFEDVPALQETVSNQHEVVVEEVLYTERYSYLDVTEGDKRYWVAITRRDINAGETYMYEGGLLKRNFFSQEFNRTFETIYLVSNFWKKPAGRSDDAVLDEAFAEMQGNVDLNVGNIDPAPGAIRIADLIANKEQYAGKTVKITGKCVKVNPMIMERNWLHIQDGSGEEIELTITTTENVPLGAIVTLEGVIALNKDFGAGYRYDIIMEGAVLK